MKLNTTIIYVTHDQTEAMTMGSKIVVLKDGVMDGSLVTKVHPGTEIRIEDQIKLYFNTGQIHLFDKDNGRRII